MTVPFSGQIDWSRPWLAPYRDAGQAVLAASDWRAALNAVAQRSDLRNHRNLPIHFVAQGDLPPGTAYEAFISATGGVPTRDNLHDFFNALVWLTFPRIKRQLNALQAAEIGKAAQAAPRGRLRDAATIFDENAALLVSSDPDWMADLRGHRWQKALFSQRDAFGRSVSVILFGHALMEKLVSPYKAITAHAWTMPVDADFFSPSWCEPMKVLDDAAVRRLDAGLATADFTPLPVLGVPGWWPDQGADFYADVEVFRPKRDKFEAGCRN